MNNTDNVKLKTSFYSLLQCLKKHERAHTSSARVFKHLKNGVRSLGETAKSEKAKKLISGEICKEPCLDILLTDLEQSSFSLLLPFRSYKNTSELVFVTSVPFRFQPERSSGEERSSDKAELSSLAFKKHELARFLINEIKPTRASSHNRFANGAKLIALNSNNKGTHLRTSTYLFNVKTSPSNKTSSLVFFQKTLLEKAGRSFKPLSLQNLLQKIVTKKRAFKKQSFLTSSFFNEVLQIHGFAQKIRPTLCVKLKVGDYVHCGDKIGYSSETPIVISESGKILKISQTQITVQKMQPVLFYSQAEIHVESNEWVKRGTPILTLAHQTLVTGDIVQGIPRIEQLFEASTSAPAALQNLSEHSQSNLDVNLKSQNTESKAFDNKNLLPASSSFTQIRNGDLFSLNLEGTSEAPTENLYTSNSEALDNNRFATGDLEPMLLYKTLQSQVRETFRKKWEQLPLTVAVRQSLEEIQQIIVESIQKVYLSQGVLIADKHIEIIVRQMTSKAQIFDGGNTGLLIDEVLSLQQIENANISTPGQKALYLPVVMGLTRAALSSDSFVSAASFQETTRVLSRDAVAGKTDFLRGLKEKVIIGDLIDAGTGLDVFYVYSLFSKKVFENKFREILNRKITHKTLKKLVLTVAK